MKKEISKIERIGNIAIWVGLGLAIIYFSYQIVGGLVSKWHILFS